MGAPTNSDFASHGSYLPPPETVEVAERVGVSRATAQRYLAELVRAGLLELNLQYGTTGRPTHRYRART